MHEGYRDLAVELARTAGKLLIGAMLAVLHEIP